MIRSDENAVRMAGVFRFSFETSRALLAKIRRVALLTLAAASWPFFVLADETAIIAVDFDEVATGKMSPETLSSLFGRLHWHHLDDRAMVIASGESDFGRILEVRYPKGAYGSQRSGASFVGKLPPAREYYLTYRVRFSEEFPFTKGGKLPGLSSGGSEFTGGRIPPETGGWSARYMWRRQGDLELYLYHPEMEGPSGDRIAFDFRCEPSTWYSLTQRVRVNDPGKSNGTIEVWIDGTRRLHREGLRLLGEKKGLIDSFLFSTFFGGSGKDWAPDSDCSVRFDDFRISTQLPPLLR